MSEANESGTPLEWFSAKGGAAANGLPGVDRPVEELEAAFRTGDPANVLLEVAEVVGSGEYRRSIR